MKSKFTKLKYEINRAKADGHLIDAYAAGINGVETTHHQTAAAPYELTEFQPNPKEWWRFANNSK